MTDIQRYFSDRGNREGKDPGAEGWWEGPVGCSELRSSAEMLQAEWMMWRMQAALSAPAPPSATVALPFLFCRQEKEAELLLLR